ncbi:MAG: hypothetical protein Tsb0016_26110 [Sphingomonadales bacterium]
MSAQFIDPATERDFRASVDSGQRRLSIQAALVMAAAIAALSAFDFWLMPHDARSWLCAAFCGLAIAAVLSVAITAWRGSTVAWPFAASLWSCALLLLASNGAMLWLRPPQADGLTLILMGQMLFAALVLAARPKLAVGFVLACGALYGLAGLSIGYDAALGRDAMIVAAAGFIAIELIRRPALDRRALYCANANWRNSNAEMQRVMGDLESERDAVQTAAARNITLMEEMDFMRRDAEQQSAFLRVVFDNISQGVAVFSHDQKLSTWNQGFETLLGLPPALAREGAALADIVGYHLDLGAADSQTYTVETALKTLRDIQSGDQPPLHIEAPGADGRVLNIGAAAIPGGGLLLTYADITDSKAAEQAALHQAEHDALTGLKNRRGFMAALRATAAQIGDRAPFALALFDLDGFKAVNDSHGHPFGDALLQRVGEIIADEVRGGDCVARLGGDEFAVIFYPIRHAADAEIPARRIIDRLAQPIEVNGRSVAVGTSIGLGFYPEDGVALNELLDRVDQALYRAKHRGKGRMERVAA